MRRSHRLLGFSSSSASGSETSEASARATRPMSSRMFGAVSLPNVSLALLARRSRKAALLRLPVSGGTRLVSRHISITVFVLELVHRRSILTSSRRWNRMPSFLFSYGKLLTGDLHCPFVVEVACRAADFDGPAADGEYEV